MGEKLTNTFMGMPIVARLTSFAGGWAVVSEVGQGRDAYYHVVGWHPEHGMTETKILIADMQRILDAAGRAALSQGGNGNG